MRKMLACIAVCVGLLAVAPPTAHAATEAQKAAANAGCFGGSIVLLHFSGTPSFCAFGRRTSSYVTIPKLVFTRAAIEACTDNQGNITYAPSGVPCITDAGYFAGLATQNMVIQSVDMTNATDWLSTGGTTAANGVGPDGTSTADAFTENALAGVHNLNGAAGASQSFTSGTTYTEAFYVKEGSGLLAQLTFGVTAFAGLGYANYDVSSNCDVVGSGGTFLNAGTQAYSNGWCRIWFTATATTTVSPSGSNATFVTINSSGAARSPTFTGTGRVYTLWCPQVEPLNSDGPCIATTTTAVSRPADSMKITGLAPILSGVFTESTTSNFIQQPLSTTRVISEVSDGTSANRYDFRMASTNNGAVVASTSSVDTTLGVTGNITMAARLLISARVMATAYQPAAQGALVALQTYAKPAGLNEFDIGMTAAGVGQCNCYIQVTQILGNISDGALRGLTAGAP